jgi:hypothetical protein
MLAYSGLFPGHIVSQFLTDLGHGFGTAIAGCHEDGTAKQQPANGAKKRCPFCAGYASFQLAALGSPTLLVPPKIVGGDALAITDDAGLRKSVITPQSRGPPLLSA